MQKIRFCVSTRCRKYRTIDGHVNIGGAVFFCALFIFVFSVAQGFGHMIFLCLYPVRYYFI